MIPAYSHHLILIKNNHGDTVKGSIMPKLQFVVRYELVDSDVMIVHASMSNPVHSDLYVQTNRTDILSITLLTSNSCVLWDKTL